MTDIFADALSTAPLVTNDVHVDRVATAPSQNDGVGATSHSHTDSDRPAAPRKRRRTATTTSLVITKLLPPTPDGDIPRVDCAYVGVGDRVVPVPLWNQYTVTWRHETRLMSPFIVVHPREPWFQQLVDLHGSNTVTHRVLEKEIMVVIRQSITYASGVARARGDTWSGDASDLTHDDDSDGANYGSALVEIEVAQFRVTVVNHLRTLVFKHDVRTLTFITDWIAPLISSLARRQMDSKAPSQTASRAPSQLVLARGIGSAGFSFDRPILPNIRDKVIWNPTTHKWAIALKKPKGTPNELFDVSPLLRGAAYDAAKTAAYYSAIQAWNLLDGSTRFRIAL